jgi:hypothetical protein
MLTNFAALARNVVMLTEKAIYAYRITGLPNCFFRGYNIAFFFHGYYILGVFFLRHCKILLDDFIITRSNISTTDSCT